MLIKVTADYGCAPLWIRRERDEVFLPCEPDDLQLSPALSGRLGAWRRWYESMINIADPYDSRPVEEAGQAALEAEGRHLAARVAEELPHATVWFYRDQQPEPDGRAA
ncbi:hypothetical protein [Actinoplanes sp. NBRC 103695]|uniref:hypothetical protein n=1 Tax=Actinoplanes sp. NBRC 103695 TaxID=3032202 RepID=UPI00249FABF9|nr:hypothetical protein [Actinoplanes sp. NBRC 103695]GLY92750.1 hypothetical protein Acsp02_00060 [Actinoplanes sp. NBRC 103695]